MRNATRRSKFDERERETVSNQTSLLIVQFYCPADEDTLERGKIFFLPFSPPFLPYLNPNEGKDLIARNVISGCHPCDACCDTRRENWSNNYRNKPEKFLRHVIAVTAREKVDNFLSTECFTGMKDISALRSKRREVLMTSKCGRGMLERLSLDCRDNLNDFTIQISSTV